MEKQISTNFENGRRPAWLSSGHIPSLDGLRGIAVSLVIFAHMHQTHGFPDSSILQSFGRVGNLGSIGVNIFFVLSGFLITTLLCREEERWNQVSLRRFYLRRVLRIVPAYTFFLVFVWGLDVAGTTDVGRRDWIAALTYTMNFRHKPNWIVGHLWSLSIEEHFYIIWPFVFMLVSRRFAIAGLLGVLILGPVIRWGVLIWSPRFTPMTDLWTFTRLDCIAAGCLLATLSRKVSFLSRLDRMGRYWPVALGVLVATQVMAAVSGKFAVGVAPSATAFLLAILVWAAVRQAPRWLESPALTIIGVGSYSLYLWQQIFLNPHEIHWWTGFPQNVMLVSLGACTSYWIIERPFLRIKSQLSPGPSLPVAGKEVSEQKLLLEESGRSA